MAKEKKIFKIWDITNGKYVTGSKNKSQWTSIGWVTSKIEDEIGMTGYRSYGNRQRRNPDEFEVREFKLVLENTMDGGDLFREKAEIERIKREGAKKYAKTVEDLKLAMPGYPVNTIKDLYKKCMLSSNMNQILEPHMKVLSENYKYTQ